MISPGSVHQQLYTLLQIPIQVQGLLTVVVWFGIAQELLNVIIKRGYRLFKKKMYKHYYFTYDNRFHRFRPNSHFENHIGMILEHTLCFYTQTRWSDTDHLEINKKLKL